MTVGGKHWFHKQSREKKKKIIKKAEKYNSIKQFHSWALSTMKRMSWLPERTGTDGTFT